MRTITPFLGVSNIQNDEVLIYCYITPSSGAFKKNELTFIKAKTAFLIPVDLSQSNMQLRHFLLGLISVQEVIDYFL